MGIASLYVEAEDVFVVVWDGSVSGTEWERVVDEQLDDDPAWPRGRRRLIDVTTFVPSELTAGDIATVIESARERIHAVAGRRQGVVASHAWDLAREFAERSTALGATTIVFDRLDDACAWLHVDPAVVRPVIARLRAELRAPDGRKA